MPEDITEDIRRYKLDWAPHWWLFFLLHDNNVTFILASSRSSSILLWAEENFGKDMNWWVTSSGINYLKNLCFFIIGCVLIACVIVGYSADACSSLNYWRPCRIKTLEFSWPGAHVYLCLSRGDISLTDKQHSVPWVIQHRVTLSMQGEPETLSSYYNTFWGCEGKTGNPQDIRV